MFDTHLASDPVAVSLSWTASRGIDIRTWPIDGPPGSPGHPVLYLVEPGSEPPACELLEDWLRLPLDLDELKARADRLLARASACGAILVRVDEGGAVHIGDEVIILSEQETRLMRLLVERQGQLVSRDDLARAIWPESPPQDPRALDNRLKTLRLRLKGQPVRIHTVRGWGLLLETLWA